METEMPDPEVQNSTEFSYYIQRKGIRYDYSRRSPEQLVEDVNRAHDFLRKLVREKDGMQRKLDRQWLWIKVLGASVAGAWALVVALVALLLDYR